MWLVFRRQTDTIHQVQVSNKGKTAMFAHYFSDRSKLFNWEKKI